MKAFFISPFWRASFFLSGMIFGVGIYAIPYVFSRVGFWLGTLELFVLAGITLLVHLLYGEIVLRTREYHRLPGYVGMYLGPFFKKFSTFSYFIGFSIALGSYVLLGGEFLSNLFSPGDIWIYIFFLIGAFFLFFNVRFNAKVDSFLVLAIIAAVGFLFLKATSHLKVDYLTTIDVSQWFLPYGVIMFALAGMAAVPDMVAILENKPKLLRKAIITGTLLPAMLYFIFAFTIVGVSGPGTSTEAIRGAAALLGPDALVIGSILGLLSTMSGFLVLGSVFKGMMHLDLNFSWRMSWFITILIPFLLIFLGVRNYLSLIAFAGGVTLAVDGLLTLLVYRKAVKRGDRHSEYALHIPTAILFLLGGIFLFGAVYTFLY